MASLLSNIVNNLLETIHKIKFESGNDGKKCEACEITNEVWNCSLEYTNLKMI